MAEPVTDPLEDAVPRAVWRRKGDETEVIIDHEWTWDGRMFACWYRGSRRRLSLTEEQLVRDWEPVRA